MVDVGVITDGDVDMAAAGRRRLKISVITPVYNERDNIPHLVDALVEVLDRTYDDWEIIAVNDGSVDGSTEALWTAAQGQPRFKVINLRRNYGQTAAMMAGIDNASGEVIVLIDADLQNDPVDIPMLIDKLEEGFDVVSGWRQDRKDAALRRNFVSRMANRLISAISGVHLHDYGCTLKAYRASVLKGVRLYGEMHRFIPIYASWMGAKVCECVVLHHPRRTGSSKYGMNRVVKVILDLLVVKFLDKYFVKPIYVFGGFGIISILISFATMAVALYWKFIDGYSLILTPLPLLAAMTFLVGSISILMGLLAEILVRIYFESQNRAAYEVGVRLNFAKSE